MSLSDAVEVCTGQIVQHAQRREDSRRVIEGLPGNRSTKAAASPAPTEARERVAIVPSRADAESILELVGTADLLDGKVRTLRRGRHAGKVTILVSPKRADQVRATIILVSGRKSDSGRLCRLANVVWRGGNARAWTDGEILTLRRGGSLKR